MIILLAAVFIRQAALRLWDLAHGNLGRTCLIQVGYSCQTTCVKQNIHCIALHYLIPALFDVYVYICNTSFFCVKIVYGLKRICVSHLGATQILNEYPLLSGTRCGRVTTLLPSAAIRRIDSGRVETRS